jgi:tRNA-Thr(GGU) m(6)t(6)A37 methyltransferase TsaA
MSDPFVLRPIGIIHSPFTTTEEIPLDGGRCVVEVFSPYADGLDGIDGSSHLVVMGFLHLSERDILKTRPRKVDPGGPEKGVFSTRSPVRPNPVSLTIVPLVGRDGLLLTVDHLDLVDGTPLVDLKAYSPGWDGVFSARHSFRANAAALDHTRLIACMERDLENFVGSAASEPAARWGLCAAFVGACAIGVDPRQPALRLRVNRASVITEALMAVTGAAQCNGRLVVEPDDAPLCVAFEHGERRLELTAALDSVPREVDDWAPAFAVRRFGF